MAKDIAGRVATATPTQLFLGLAWLGATLYATQARITAAADLPGVVAATLLISASIGAAAGSPLRSARGRLLAGLALGTLVGLAAAAGSWFGYGGGAPAMELAITVGGASLAGGALAVLPAQVLKAGLWGTTWVFVAGVLFGVLPTNRVELLGDTRLALGQSLVTGAVAALCTLPFLRMERHRALWYLVGGALPGLVLLGAERLTRAATAAAELVHGSRIESTALVGVSDPARLRHALIVLAVGGLIGMLVGALSSLWSWARRRRRAARLDISHHSLARIGLGAGERYGFVLAGSYAVQAAGFLTRPSADVDLFTVWERRGEFETATRAIVDAYLAAGLSVEVDRRHDTFSRLTVSDGVRTATVELGLDSRAHEPVQSSIGPVLHPEDAVANKMRALYERAHASDFIDIDAVLRSGRYDRAALLQLAERSDISFERRLFADALAQAQLLDAEQFARYGLVGEDLDGLRQRFAEWRASLLEAAELAP